MNFRTAVLMTCHNRIETTIACLSRLMPQLDFRDAVFLVDDGSDDATGAKVRALYPSIRVIDADGTLYWAKGMRRAWEAAVAERSDWDCFLWLNDDVMLKPDALAIAISDWRKCKREDAVIVGACSEDETEQICSYGATDSNDLRIIPIGNTPQLATGWFTGNFLLVPNATYRKVGMISGDYSHARADYDYAERLKRAGCPFYSSVHYVGICRDDSKGKFSGTRLLERICWLHEPGYFNLKDLYLFKSRYYGRFRAFISCIHLIVIILKGFR